MQTKLVRKDSDQLADIIVKSVLAVSEKNGDTYEVDIDDIHAVVDVSPGSVRHHLGVSSGYLHCNRCDAFNRNSPQPALTGFPEFRLGSNHFTDHIPGTVTPRLRAKRYVGQPRHGCNSNSAFELMGA